MINTEISKKSEKKANVFQNKQIKNARYAQLVILYFTVTIQSAIVTSAFSVSISAIVKAFKLSNLFVLVVLSIYHILLGLCSIPLTRFANRYKQMYISLGTLLVCYGGIIFILPVISKSRQIGVDIQSTLCTESSKNVIGKKDQRQSSRLILIYLGYALIGIGSAFFSTISVKFIMETFEKSRRQLLTSIYFFCQVLGTFSIFVFSRYYLTIPMIAWKKQEAQMLPEDDIWIGAYWLPYLIGSCLLFVLMICNTIVSRIVARNSVSNRFKKSSSSIYSTSDFMRGSIKILGNFQLLVLILAYSFINLAKNSLSSYLQVYLEIQFHVPSNKASFYGGIPAITTGVYYYEEISSKQQKIALCKHCNRNHQFRLFNVFIFPLRFATDQRS
ncbi:Solute carrier organic anion transporter family member 4A1 [Thelohanellus kitauei]|uniref:Solute carrier organic anion transporter family member 4A1 n=1 Tax=Thelohanellus kitauei TaxID=669202 RepID=A0A0C2MN97_THEKT|nr:Solute carrier organic anion transporter family member 4A1 [Thelohanellus kitauei]